MFIKQVRTYVVLFYIRSNRGTDWRLMFVRFWLQVIIEGFKSYKEQVATEPFSSKVNCVGNYFLTADF